MAAMAPGQPGDAARRPRTHLHGRAPSGTGLACPGRACCHRGSTAWHGRAPSRRDSPAGAAGWSPAGRGGRSPAGPGPGPAMPCHDPRMLTWSWQSRYCRGSPVHGSSSVDLRPQRQRGGDGARPPRAALPAPCVPHGVIPHLRGQDAAEPPSCSRVGSDASPTRHWERGPRCPAWGPHPAGAAAQKGRGRVRLPRCPPRSLPLQNQAEI